MMIVDAIRECVEQTGDPLLSHITEHCSRYGYDAESVRMFVRMMVERDELRMKEDSIDHDWSYRRGKNWDYSTRRSLRKEGE